jgi:hypothetical protein
MIRVSGRGTTSSELPIDLAAARLYFQDAVAFLDKIEAVDKVKPLSRPGAFLITHHAVGGLNYKVVLVTCMQVDWHETGLTLSPLDFDADKVACEYPIVKGYSDGALDLIGRGDRTAVDFKFTMEVEIPIVGALKIIPRPVVQATADGIMQFEVKRTVQNLFRAVQSDFAAMASKS